MTNDTVEDLTAAVKGRTVPRRFLEIVSELGPRVALRRMDGDSPGSWREWTWSEVEDLAAQAAAGLRALGVEAGQRVMLLMRNRPDFHWLDLAAQFLRATPVSIYNSSSGEEVQYLVEHSEARVVIVEDAAYLARLQEVREQLPSLAHVLVIEAHTSLSSDAGAEGVAPVSVLFEHGRADLVALANETDPDDLATIIYTSGTTGPPKGVMISQFNVTYTAEQLTRCLALAPEEFVGLRLVSYLPMAHIAERMNSHYLWAMSGTEITCCPDPSQIAVYAREVRPEIIFGVPRVWEKVHAGVNAALTADPEKQQRFGEGLALALEIKAAERAGTATQEQLETWAFLDAVAFSTVRQLVGLDSVRVAISGAAPLASDILEWFQAIGVPLSEIYGMSESTGPMTWAPYAIKPGTVGPAIPGSELKLDEDGEVIFRGGNVFQGYLKDPEKTAETIIDGWLHSGDIGELDDDGYLRIVDRKKELIITAGGKNKSPANLENALKLIPLVGQAAAVGDARRYIAAILVLDPEVATAWAVARGLADVPLEQLAQHPEVVAEVQRGVDEVNERFAQVEQIKRFRLVGAEWLPGSEVLTPTSKLKRRGISNRYASVIEELYQP
jgi:long-chain acyl-CoA synthetase